MNTTLSKNKEWRKVKLGDLVISANTGLDAIKRAPIVNEDTGIKCFRIQDASQNKSYGDWGFTKVNKLNYEKFKLLEGDILIARTGNSVGVNYLVKKNINAVFNNGLIRLRVNDKVDYRFLYIFISSQYFLRLIDTIAYGTSTQPNIQIGSLLSFELLLPEKKEQLIIIEVLSSLDNKIELLQKQNETLEKMAQAIFHEWFVEFNFPNEKGEPYKASGGKMIESELGEIPEGWEMVVVDEMFNFEKGIEVGSMNYLNKRKKLSDLYFYRVQDISKYGDTPSIFVNEKLLKNKIFSEEDVLISLDGTLGRVYVGGNGGYSSGIRKVSGKKGFISKSFILFLLKSPQFQQGLISFTSAETTIKHAGGALKYIMIPINEEIISKSTFLLEPVFEKIISNVKQIKKLEEARDIILPKLMSGELRIKI